VRKGTPIDENEDERQSQMIDVLIIEISVDDRYGEGHGCAFHGT